MVTGILVSGQLCAAPQGRGCAGSPRSPPTSGAVLSGLGPALSDAAHQLAAPKAREVGASLVDMSGSGGRRVTESVAPGLWVPPCGRLASRRDSGARPAPRGAVSSEERGTEPRLARGAWGPPGLPRQCGFLPGQDWD